MKKNNKGFTLVEILLYISLVSVILTSVTYFAWDVIYGSIKAHVLREVQQNGRFAVERMSYEIRQAKDFAIPEGYDDKLLILNPEEKTSIYLSFTDNKITLQEGEGEAVDLTTQEVQANGSFTDMSFYYDGATEPVSKNVGVSMVVNYYNPNNLTDWLAKDEFDLSIELRAD